MNPLQIASKKATRCFDNLAPEASRGNNCSQQEPPHQPKVLGTSLEAQKSSRTNHCSQRLGPPKRYPAPTIVATPGVHKKNHCSIIQSPRSCPNVDQKLTPIAKNAFVTKLLAPKFCAEWSDREIHSSYGDPFREHFCVYASRSKD